VSSATGGRDDLRVVRNWWEGRPPCRPQLVGGTISVSSATGGRDDLCVVRNWWEGRPPCRAVPMCESLTELSALGDS